MVTFVKFIACIFLYYYLNYITTTLDPHRFALTWSQTLNVYARAKRINLLTGSMMFGCQVSSSRKNMNNNIIMFTYPSVVVSINNVLINHTVKTTHLKPTHSLVLYFWQQHDTNFCKCTIQFSKKDATLFLK